MKNYIEMYYKIKSNALTMILMLVIINYLLRKLLIIN